MKEGYINIDEERIKRKLNISKRLMDKKCEKYPNDVIMGDDGYYTTNKDILFMLIDGIDKKTKFTKYKDKEWVRIKKEYIDEDLSQKEIKEKYNVSKEDIEYNLKGVKKEHKEYNKVVESTFDERKFMDRFSDHR